MGRSKEDLIIRYKMGMYALLSTNFRIIGYWRLVSCFMFHEHFFTFCFIIFNMNHIYADMVPYELCICMAICHTLMAAWPWLHHIASGSQVLMFRTRSDNYMHYHYHGSVAQSNPICVLFFINKFLARIYSVFLVFPGRFNFPKYLLEETDYALQSAVGSKGYNDGQCWIGECKECRCAITLPLASWAMLKKSELASYLS